MTRGVLPPEYAPLIPQEGPRLHPLHEKDLEINKQRNQSAQRSPGQAVQRSRGSLGPHHQRWAPQSPSCRRSPSPKTQSAHITRGTWTAREYARVGGRA